MPYLAHDDEITRRLAGEAVSAMLGLDLEDDSLWEKESPDDPAISGDSPDQDEDDLDEELESSGLDELPLPNAEAIGARWADVSTRWDARTRWMGGKPLLRGTASIMRDAPCRRLDTLANEALARSSSPTARWPSRAAAQQQLEHIRGLA